MRNTNFTLPLFCRLLVCSFLVAMTQQAVALPSLLGVQQMATGSYHTCAIVNGGAQCWGQNDAGQLGDRTLIDRVGPVAVSGLQSGVTALSAGQYHTCAIVDGGAQCWGANNIGQLGNSATGFNVSMPVHVNGLNSGVTAIAAGNQFTCAIVNGGVQCWGDNQYGELGNGTTTYSDTPVAVLGLESGVTAIAAGYLQACAIVNGAAQCWGDNIYGGLGNGTNANSSTPVSVIGLSSGVAAIVVGELHTCALAGAGVLCWGDNEHGELGNGSTTSTNTPVAVTGLSSGVSAITAGAEHNCVIVDAALKCWGYNADGELGNAPAVDSHVPIPVTFIGSPAVTAVAAGQYHTCATVAPTSGPTKMECWGSNSFAQLGIGGAPLYGETPVQVTGLSSGVTAIGGGDSAYHGCAIVNGAATCWGDNFTGDLGNNSDAASGVPVPVSNANSQVSSVAVGHTHSCAIINRAASCWGSNYYGGWVTARRPRVLCPRK